MADRELLKIKRDRSVSQFRESVKELDKGFEKSVKAIDKAWDKVEKSYSELLDTHVDLVLETGESLSEEAHQNFIYEFSDEKDEAFERAENHRQRVIMEETHEEDKPELMKVHHMQKIRRARLGHPMRKSATEPRLPLQNVLLRRAVTEHRWKFPDMRRGTSLALRTARPIRRQHAQTRARAQPMRTERASGRRVPSSALQSFESLTESKSGPHKAINYRGNSKQEKRFESSSVVEFAVSVKGDGKKASYRICPSFPSTTTRGLDLLLRYKKTRDKPGGRTVMSNASETEGGVQDRKMAEALFSYGAESGEELSIEETEDVAIISDEDAGMWVVESGKGIGLVPSSHVWPSDELKEIAGVDKSVKKEGKAILTKVPTF